MKSVQSLFCLLLFNYVFNRLYQETQIFVCLLFYIHATSKIILCQVPTCDRMHSWRLCSAASLGHQATGTMACYATQSLYPVTEPTSPCPILIMMSARLGSNKYHFKVIGLTRLARFGFEPARFGLPDFQHGRRTLYSFCHSLVNVDTLIIQ